MQNSLRFFREAFFTFWEHAYNLEKMFSFSAAS